SSRRRHTRSKRDWSSDVCSSDLDSIAPRISFFFNAHNDFFEEIAKYRAARRIWARTMRERFGAKNGRSWWLRFHSQTAGCSLTEIGRASCRERVESWGGGGACRR